MEEYITILGTSEAEYSEKRSRFIAVACHCATEKEALEFIEKQKTKYWDARHNCFAYTVREEKINRFSDDGEPHGTAGKPMLDVILGSGVTDVAVVVTRYFGGVLLGTGGLVHAYSKATKDAIALALKVKKIHCVEYETICEYTDHAKFSALISSLNGIVEDTEYTDKVKITYLIEDKSASNFLAKLEERFSARVTANEICEKYVEI